MVENMEKKIVFIKRYPSKGELPKENVWLDTNIGYVKFDTSDSRWLVIGGIVEWWLEEIELPSEEELIEKSDLNKGSSMWFHSQGFTQGANFILNKLKGETK